MIRVLKNNIHFTGPPVIWCPNVPLPAYTCLPVWWLPVITVERCGGIIRGLNGVVKETTIFDKPRRRGVPRNQKIVLCIHQILLHIKARCTHTIQGIHTVDIYL